MILVALSTTMLEVASGLGRQGVEKRDPSASLVMTVRR